MRGECCATELHSHSGKNSSLLKCVHPMYWVSPAERLRTGGDNSLLLLKKIYLFHVGGWVWSCMLTTYKSPWKSEEGVGSLELELRDSCEVSCKC